MKKTMIVLCLIALALGLQAQQAMIFELYTNGQSAGECQITVEPRGGGKLIKETMKLNDSRGERQIQVEAIVNSNWYPDNYQMAVEAPEISGDITAEFGAEKVSISGKVGMGEMTKELEYKSRPKAFSEQYDPAGILMILPELDYTVIGQTTTYQVVLPMKMEMGEVSLTVESQDGDNYQVKGELIGGKGFSVTFNPNKNMISGFSVDGLYEAKSKSIAKTDKPEGVLPSGYHPLSLTMLKDKELIGSIVEIEGLTGSLSLKFAQENASRLYLNRFAQEFAGVISGTNADGYLEVKKIGHKVTNAPDWPLYYPLKGVEDKYTMPERGIDSDNPELIARAEGIVEPANTMWDAARALNLWVYRNVENDMQCNSAAQTFKSLKGDSRAKALLCVAMCRAIGIPARVVSGILWADGATDHTWVEVYLGEKVGWGPMDPTLNDVDDISAAHISLWIGAQVPPVMAEAVTLDEVIVED